MGTLWSSRPRAADSTAVKLKVRHDLLPNFQRAASNVSLEEVHPLLKAGVPVDGLCHRYFEKTALQQAARHGRLQCLKIRLEHHANVNLATCDGFTALHEASEHGFVDCLVAMLDHGAKINSAVTKGHCWSALHYAARNGHRDCLEVLLKYGANANATGIRGWSPLHLSVRHGHTFCVEMLLEYNAQVDRPPHVLADGRILQVPFHHAAELGHLACLEALLRHGAAVNSATAEGWTALHSAASHGRTSCVEALIRYGAHVNEMTVFLTKGTSYHDTPLHLAARHNHFLCVKALIEANGDLESRNCAGLTPANLVSDTRLRAWMLNFN